MNTNEFSNKDKLNQIVHHIEKMGEYLEVVGCEPADVSMMMYELGIYERSDNESDDVEFDIDTDELREILVEQYISLVELADMFDLDLTSINTNKVENTLTTFLPHKASKELYGGEVMPDGVKQCNACGWESLDINFKYGLCSSCGEPEWWEE